MLRKMWISICRIYLFFIYKWNVPYLMLRISLAKYTLRKFMHNFINFCYYIRFLYIILSRSEDIFYDGNEFSFFRIKICVTVCTVWILWCPSWLGIDIYYFRAEKKNGRTYHEWVIKLEDVFWIFNFFDSFLEITFSGWFNWIMYWVGTPRGILYIHIVG